MSGGLKKKEIGILLALLFLLYAFIYIKAVLIPTLPKIQEKQAQIVSQTNLISTLDHKLANLESTVAECEMKTFNNEHISEYLMDTAGVSDGLEYVEEIARMMGNDISSVNVNSPRQITISAVTPVENAPDPGAKPAAETAGAAAGYYELKVDFTTVMTYNEAMELVKYCEGGTRKTRISNFRLSLANGTSNTSGENSKANTVSSANAETDGKTANTTDTNVKGAAGSKAQTNEFLRDENSQKVNLSMSVCFYSINKGNVDRLYDYSQSRFQKFRDSNGVPFTQEKLDSKGNVILPDITSTGTGEGNTTDTLNNGQITKESADLVIKETGILIAGDNFELYDNSDSNKRISYKTSSLVDITLNLDKEKYSLNTGTATGAAKSLSGLIHDYGIKIYIDSTVLASVPENKDISLTLKILNSSDKPVSIVLTSRTNKVKVLDRSGKEVLLKSDSDKIYIV